MTDPTDRPASRPAPLCIHSVRVCALCAYANHLSTDAHIHKCPIPLINPDSHPPQTLHRMARPACHEERAHPKASRTRAPDTLHYDFHTVPAMTPAPTTPPSFASLRQTRLAPVPAVSRMMRASIEFWHETRKPG